MFWKLLLSSKILECIDFFREFRIACINLAKNHLKISYSERVKSDSEENPHNRENPFSHSVPCHISVAHSSESLERPIHGRNVLSEIIRVNQIMCNNPALGVEIVEADYHEIEA